MRRVKLGSHAASVSIGRWHSSVYESPEDVEEPEFLYDDEDDEEEEVEEDEH